LFAVVDTGADATTAVVMDAVDAVDAVESTAVVVDIVEFTEVMSIYMNMNDISSLSRGGKLTLNQLIGF
jgi:hypothetical protein